MLLKLVKLVVILMLCSLLGVGVYSFKAEIKLIRSLEEVKHERPSIGSRSINFQHLLSKTLIEEIFANASLTIKSEILKKSQNRNQQDAEGSIFHGTDIQSTRHEPASKTNPLVLTMSGSKKCNKVNNLATIALKASRIILDINNNNNNNYNYSNNLIEQYEAPSEFCPYLEKVYCDFNYPYRSMDGSCNNKKNTWWGKKETPFKRLLHPIYNDAINEPRSKSISGNKLKNPRIIALKVHSNIENTLSNISNLLPHFSQFIDHDISLTALISDEEGNPIKCFCNNDDTDCINIESTSGDPFNKDQRCMVTPRSSASFRQFDCNLGAREQLNLLTHWLDLSQTYGNDLKKNLKLRTMRHGKLKAAIIGGLKHHYLPFKKNGKCLGEGEKKKVCFQAGDVRLNQNLLLVTMQTIWMREHNRVAKHLYNMNPYWTDEKLFQEARKIVTAEYQHIIYNEWLPILIGEKISRLYHLKPVNQDYLYKYNEDIYPNVANEFSTAAFRFGHSLVRSFVSKANKDYKILANLSISQIILNPDQAFKRGGLESLARGCVLDQAGAFDSHINDDLNHHLFEKKDKDADDSSPTHRFSLAALNINRGRDHGLQTYTEYRSLCGLPYARTFDDLTNIPKHVRKRLAKVYEYVDDIDLFTGGTSELPVSGGVVGPTFACIIAKQFRDLKFGDRFYYENGEIDSNKFSLSQLDEIRKANMARILCDNVDILYIQRNPFLRRNHELNPIISCNNLSRLSYKPWKEYRYQ